MLHPLMQMETVAALPYMKLQLFPFALVGAEYPLSAARNAHTHKQNLERISIERVNDTNYQRLEFCRSTSAKLKKTAIIAMAATMYNVHVACVIPLP